MRNRLSLRTLPQNLLDEAPELHDRDTTEKTNSKTTKNTLIIKKTLSLSAGIMEARVIDKKSPKARFKTGRIIDPTAENAVSWSMSKRITQPNNR